jgi:arginine:ornithine antiporter/lysine permease
LKITSTRDGYLNVPRSARNRDLVIAILASLYTLFLIYASGLDFMLMACILLAPATVLYAFARRELGARLFTTPGLVVFIVVLIGAIVGVIGLITGFISI